MHFSMWTNGFTSLGFTPSSALVVTIRTYARDTEQLAFRYEL